MCTQHLHGIDTDVCHHAAACHSRHDCGAPVKLGSDTHNLQSGKTMHEPVLYGMSMQQSIMGMTQGDLTELG